ncbi:MBL fold metallo-hydrolase [Variovorax sp. NFACC27]|uniref:MBL fold metallo-hydrolase n=1 Tax=unclassified Variovorax TaxID=663243 RepID=UPI00089882BE|nr:Glyoxylase, beta-lactamase superfamily II [Variovorax sp. NFACC28]SEG93419.1 Glyoxylase, beta-lactamase superfamily II [Variovorax sp. NFACC29]SFD61758.1 Glyoxylase, beta-lactamase superfamily II [Variovorax sp. NFACC26]SFG90733.1 Glyoxylase, beta-lactamase superfamily II [Variovorax sp. NFACC27]
MTTKKFASHADLEEKKVSFTRLSENAYAYTAEGDPNTGIFIGDEAVMVVDTQATPAMAQDVIRRIREVTPLPIKYVLLSHYHAVRVLGASAYFKEGAEQIIASRDTYDLIVERGEQDKASEIGRFPRLFRNVESVPPGLTWPTMTFDGTMSVWLGKKLEVKIAQVGRGHTKGDTIAYLEDQKICFAGDLVEYQSTAYAGDCYFRDWPTTLDRLAGFGFEKLVPGRGAALENAADVRKAIASTRAFISDVYTLVNNGVAQGKTLNAIYKETVAALRPTYGHWVIFDHCMPFDVTRAYDEATGYAHPRIWTAERDIEMWNELEG